MVRVEQFSSHQTKDTDPSMSPTHMVTVDASFSATICGMLVAGSNSRQSALRTPCFFGISHSWLGNRFGRCSVWLGLFLLLLPPAVLLHAQFMQSTSGPNEFDTAGRGGRGQAGGIRPGTASTTT
jgi:hypothetical protein